MQQYMNFKIIKVSYIGTFNSQTFKDANMHSYLTNHIKL